VTGSATRAGLERSVAFGLVPGLELVDPAAVDAVPPRHLLRGLTFKNGALITTGLRHRRALSLTNLSPMS
jgi:hypothetical protein